MSRKPKYFDRRFRAELLHPKHWPTWFAIGVLVFFGLMPAWLRDPIARLLARLVKKIAKKPLKVARANLETCFPDKSKAEIDKLLDENIESFV